MDKVKIDKEVDKIMGFYGEEPVHTMFGLSYAEYIVIPRAVLQSMPIEWQKRFVRCWEELQLTIDWLPTDAYYHVSLKDGETGKFKNDPLGGYERGRRRIAHRDGTIVN